MHRIGDIVSRQNAERRDLDPLLDVFAFLGRSVEGIEPARFWIFAAVSQSHADAQARALLHSRRFTQATETA